jgi:hypothetical protein
MKNDNGSRNSEDIDFINNSALKGAVNKTKKKQTFKYILIAFVTSSLLLTMVFSGANFILNKRLESNDDSFNSTVMGANISNQSTQYTHNTFSVIAETTEYKIVGDRQIIWDKTTKEIPLFGHADTIKGERESQINKIDQGSKRVVHYNDYNNERKLDFYHPGVSYDHLPNEFEIMDELGDNKLIELGLSFNKPLTLAELGEKIGYKNVAWLWIDTTSDSKKRQMSKELNSDDLKTLDGDNAYGFSVDEKQPYDKGSDQEYIEAMEQLGKSSELITKYVRSLKKNALSPEGEVLISGVVVTGTPEEVKKFKENDIVRASVLGVTIDKY